MNDAVAALVRDIGPSATLGLFALFRTGSTTQHRAIVAAIDTGDDELFRRATHTLASTSALIGGNEVEQCCRTAERAGLAGTGTAAFLVRLDALLVALGDDVRNMTNLLSSAR